MVVAFVWLVCHERKPRDSSGARCLALHRAYARLLDLLLLLPTCASVIAAGIALRVVIERRPGSDWANVTDRGPPAPRLAESSGVGDHLGVLASYPAAVTHVRGGNAASTDELEDARAVQTEQGGGLVHGEPHLAVLRRAPPQVVLCLPRG